MVSNAVLLSTCVLLNAASVVLGARSWVTESNRGSSECYFRGYKPGGKLKRLRDISSPQFAKANSKLSQILKSTGEYAELLSGSIDLVTDVTDALPKLVPALALFSGVVKLAAGKQEISAEDVMKKSQAAMNRLTKEVNDKFDDMEQYIKQSFLDENKILLQKTVDVFFRSWNHCLLKENRRRANDCQEQVYRDIDSWHDQFAIYQTELHMDVPTWVSDYYYSFDGIKIRKLEAFLLPMRNYVTVEMMVLKPLIEVMIDGTSLERKIAKTYVKEMQQKAVFFDTYFRRAKTSVIKYWEGDEKISPCYKESDIVCDNGKKLEESGVHTANKYYCECKMDAEATSCEQGVYWRADGEEPSSYTTVDKAEKAAVKKFAFDTILKLRKDIEKKTLPLVKKYWNTELDPFISSLTDAINYANEKANDLNIAEVRRGIS